MPALDRPAAGPWAHCTATALTACIACQGVSAITATPPVLPRNGGTASTCSTPGRACAGLASKEATLPPSVGHITTLA